MRRLATLLAALLLAFGWAGSGSAFSQGAGDDQYQDPFGDEPSQSDSGGGGGSGSDGGLSDEPPVSGGGSSGSGSSGSGSSATGSSGSGTATSTGTETAVQATGQLPNTGSEPLLLMSLGVAFALTGVGLRLRTIDPNAF